MNKSLFSNTVASVLVLLGLVISGPSQIYLFNTGLFALSGGITNWLAVHMLFERVPGLYGSGVIPLRFEEFKIGIRKLIMDQFFNRADLEAFFHGADDTREKISDSLKQAILDLDLDSAFEALLDVIMSSSFSGMLNMVGGRDALNPLQSPFVEKMREYFQSQFANLGFQDQVQQALKNALDDETIRLKVEALIDQRLDQMTPQMVKEVIQEMIREHLGWLVVWGCAFGGLIGLVFTLISNI
ncbi:MAG: DUF445 domain-containing protein [Gammaproteobacteria bacterium]|nr:DUF445 domain-containing protein [Gammaproteobacteria bacterium]